jgi:hypothetical protein
VFGLNRAGIGPMAPDISAVTLRRAFLESIGEVVERLGVTARHVIYGHTHRGGPFERDSPAEWRAPGGARLFNTASWVFDLNFIGPGQVDNPYWPGTLVRVPEAGDPVVERVLTDPEVAREVSATGRGRA